MSARLIWFSQDSKAFQHLSSSKLSDPCSCFILVLVNILLWHRSMILRIASVITELSLIFHFFKKKFQERNILIGKPWRCCMTLRVKRDTIMEQSDWSVPLLIGREAHIAPDPFVARISFHSSCWNCCKIFIFGRKTGQILRPEPRWVGLTIGVKGVKFYEVCIMFYSFLSPSWSNWYFKHLWMCMAWIVKSKNSQEIPCFYRKSFCEWFSDANCSWWTFY